MTVLFENESGIELEFDEEALAKRVIPAALEELNCPYEAEVSLLLTDDDGICEVNRRMRGIGNPTDVLSFPAMEFEEAGLFAENLPEDCFDPDTGELVLGDILISLDKVRAQAQEYGHSKEREYAFLIVHSVLHLCGFDHMESRDAQVMEEKQRIIMEKLKITREPSCGE